MRFAGRKANRNAKIDVQQLNQLVVQHDYQQKLSQQLAAPITPSIDDHWSSLNDVMLSAASNACGHTKRQHSPWISTTSLQLMDSCRAITTSSSQNTTRQNVHRELSKSLCCDREKWLDCLLYTSPSPRDGATSRMPSSA